MKPLHTKKKFRDTWLLLGELYITNDPAINFGRRAPYKHLGLCMTLANLYTKGEINFTTWAMMSNTINEDLDALDRDSSYFCCVFNPANKELRGMYCLLMAAQCMGDENDSH